MENTSLDFVVDLERCIGCGQCSTDCPAMIISMENNLPVIAPHLEEYCIGCLHCMALCTEEALSILGNQPQEGLLSKTLELPSADQMEALIKRRRSVRNYVDANLDKALIDRLLDVTWHAPSGHNDRGVHLTVVDDKGVLYDLREEVFAGLEKVIAEGRLPEGMEMFSDIMTMWKENRKDILFRGAPHLLLVSADRESASPTQDCMIALTTFSLFAESCGLGTVWNGLATLTLKELIPEMMPKLGIPEGYELGYAIGFGRPAIRYRRTINRGAARVNRVVL